MSSWLATDRIDSKAVGRSNAKDPLSPTLLQRFPYTHNQGLVFQFIVKTNTSQYKQPRGRQALRML